jgi:hypothetical protein
MAATAQPNAAASAETEWLAFHVDKLYVSFN